MVACAVYIYAESVVKEHWRSLPGVSTRTTAELQDIAKRAKVHWSGQVPMHVGFLQALNSAPRLEKR